MYCRNNVGKFIGEKKFEIGILVNLRFAPADHNGWTGCPAGRLINWSFYLRNLSGRTLAVVTVLNLAAGYLVGFQTTGYPPNMQVGFF